MRPTLRATSAVFALVAACCGSALADDDDDKAGKKAKMKFWNLTGVELVEVMLAPAGTGKFGENQTKNDDDNTIETDERLPLVGVEAGKYDIQIKDKAGRSCLIKDVDVKAGGPYAFSIEADQLTDCKP